MRRSGETMSGTMSGLVLAACVLAATDAWSAASVGLVASPYQAPGAGSDVVVSLTASSIDGVTSLDLSYTYDPALLTPTGVFPTAYSHGAALTFSFATPGVVQVHLAKATAFAGSGEVAWVMFHVASAVPSGTVTSMSWTSASLNNDAVPCGTTGASVAIGSAPVTIGASRSAFGLHGAQIQLPISATALAGGSSFDLTLMFDPNVLTAASVQKTSFTSCMSLTANTATPGTVRISLFGLCSLSGSGPLAMVVMNVVGPNGSRTPLNVTRGSVDEGQYASVLSDGLFNACGTADADGDGYSVCAGDCNDADPSVHPGAVELCNGIDDDCNSVIDDAAAPVAAPFIHVDKEGSDAFVSWPPVAASTAYDVLRGDVDALQSSGIAPSVNGCSGSRITTNYQTDSHVPTSGTGDWYLVRPANCGGSGSYDAGEPRQSGSRDTASRTAQISCP